MSTRATKSMNALEIASELKNFMLSEAAMETGKGIIVDRLLRFLDAEVQAGQTSVSIDMLRKVVELWR